jgi:hypothetical protein
MSLDDGASYTFSLFGLMSFGACDMIEMARAANISFPPAFQWTVNVPEDATSLTFDPGIEVTGGTAGEDYDFWVHMRAGEYVVYEMVDLFGMAMPLRVQTVDATYENPAEPIVLTAYTDPPLEPGTLYYFSINYLGCPMGASTVSAEVGYDPVEDPEAEEEPEPVPDEEPEMEPDASDDVEDPDGGDVVARGGACGCSMVR